MHAAKLHWDRFRVTADLEDLNATIEHMNIVVVVLPKEHPSFATSVDGLSKFYAIRYFKWNILESIT